MKTKSQIDAELELLSEDLSNLVYSDLSEQVAELERIVDELGDLRDELRAINMKDDELILKIDIRRSDDYQVFKDELAEWLSTVDIPSIRTSNGDILRLRFDDSTFDFYKEEIIITGSWDEVNDAHDFFELDDLVEFGPLSIYEPR